MIIKRIVLKTYTYISNLETKLIPYITSQILFSRLRDRNPSLSQNGADKHTRYGSIF